jgi:hypothetical protein
MPQTWPQAPPLFSSLMVSTHTSGQRRPSAHTWAFSQLVAQCALSLSVSTQVRASVILGREKGRRGREQEKQHGEA